MRQRREALATKPVFSPRLFRGVLQYGGFALLLAASGATVLADTIPLGSTAAAVEVFSFSGTFCSQSGVNSASCSLSGSTAEAVVTNGEGGMASVSLGSNATAGAAATGYFIGIEGPSTVSVPIIINGFADTQDNSTEYGESFASYYIYQGSSTGFSIFGKYFGSPQACPFLAAEGFPCLPTGQFTLNTSITSNSAFYVQLEAAAGGTNASALIDPTIMIDPSFPLADEFTLVADPGVLSNAVPVPPAPEPASGALLAVALAALVAARKKFRIN